MRGGGGAGLDPIARSESCSLEAAEVELVGRNICVGQTVFVLSLIKTGGRFGASASSTSDYSRSMLTLPPPPPTFGVWHWKMVTLRLKTVIVFCCFFNVEKFPTDVASLPDLQTPL